MSSASTANVCEFTHSQILQKKSTAEKRSTSLIAVTSGKGGVGKTLTSIHLAIAAQRMGLRVLIFDGDLGLANVDVVLGLQGRYNINDVLNGHISMNEILLDGPLGIKIIPSGSGIARLAQLTYVERLHLLDQVDAIEEKFDLVIVDTGAGIAPNVMHFNVVADASIIVTTPEPHAMTDAYAMMKILSEDYKKKNFFLLANMVQNAGEGLKIYERLADVAKRFIDVRLDYAGYVPVDPQVKKFVFQRRAASEKSTFTISGQAWNEAARQVLAHSDRRTKNLRRNAHEIWQDLFSKRAESNL